MSLKAIFFEPMRDDTFFLVFYNIHLINNVILFLVFYNIHLINNVILYLNKGNSTRSQKTLPFLDNNINNADINFFTSTRLACSRSSIVHKNLINF